MIGFQLFVIQMAFTQNLSDSVTIRRGFRMTLLYHEELYSRVEALDILKVNPAAEKEMRKAIISSNVGALLRFSGGVLVFIPVSQRIQRKTPTWPLAWIGSGLFAISLPFTGMAVNHSVKAAEMYNSGLSIISLEFRSCELGLTPNGLGIKIRL